uniref:ATP-binding cassette domain-containing protein n=1 Tax=Shewanella sp. AC34-MNA-CIBAN-0136 TaxID=3140463 RepID=UPI0033228ED5
ALGIVGESGSGKTTIALALSQLLSNQAHISGQIMINGQDITALSKRELRSFRSQIQMVFQDPFASINPRMTVMQIVEEGLLVQGVN